MAAERHLNQQHKTIISLLRENQALHDELYKSDEKTQKYAEKILREALNILDEANILDGRKWLFRLGKLGSTTSTQARSSQMTNGSSCWQQEMGSLHSSLLHDILFSDSGETPSSLHESMLRTEASQPPSLHESMLRSLGNSTSKWNSRGSSSVNDSSADWLLFPEDLAVPAAPKQPAQRSERQTETVKRAMTDPRSVTKTQHISIGDDGVITHQMFDHTQPGSPSITTKFLAGSDKIEITRHTRSPVRKSGEIQEISTLENVETDGGPSSILSQKRDDPPPRIRYTAWDIPNDRFSDSNQTRNVKFYGEPQDASTPTTNVQEPKKTPPRRVLFSPPHHGPLEAADFNDFMEQQVQINGSRSDAKDQAATTPQQEDTAKSDLPDPSTELVEQILEPPQPFRSADLSEQDFTTDPKELLEVAEPSKQEQDSKAPFASTELQEQDLPFTSTELQEQTNFEDLSPEPEPSEVAFTDEPNAEAEQAQSSQPKKVLNVDGLVQSVQQSKRLLGEIAFQLDRRIINFVFSAKPDSKYRRRLYGYSVQNIATMMKKVAFDPRTDQVNSQKLAELDSHYKDLLQSLRPLGYNIVKHADFAQDMVNKYGLMPLRPGFDCGTALEPSSVESLHELVASLAADHEVKDMIILVDCLAQLAQRDGKPMVYW